MASTTAATNLLLGYPSSAPQVVRRTSTDDSTQLSVYVTPGMYGNRFVKGGWCTTTVAATDANVVTAILAQLT